MRLWRTLFHQRGRHTAGVLAALIVAGLLEGLSFTALLPVLELATQPDNLPPWLITAFATVGLVPTIGPLLGLMVLGFFLKSALVLVAQRQVGYAVAAVATQLRLQLLDAFLMTRWSFALRQPAGALANSLSGEALRAGQAYLAGITMLAVLVQCLSYAAMALWVHPQAALSALAIGAAMLTLSYLPIKMAQKAGKQQTRLMRALVTRLTDSLNTIKPLRAMGRTQNANQLLTHETHALNRALRREILSSELLPALQDPLIAAIIAVGIYVFLVQWDVGIPTTVTLVLLLGRMLNQLGRVQRQYQKFLICESAHRALDDAIAAARDAKERHDGTQPPTFLRELTLEGVALEYDGQAVLRQVNLVVPVGQFTVLLGPSGSGKTTIADLMVGLVTPTTGQVRLDGVDLQAVDLAQWRRQIGYVTQEATLLHGSVFDNVALYDPQFDEAAVIAALKQAQAWDFVAAMPAQLHSPVGERGGLLSGGQRSRICLARALVHRPALLILDEATGALDEATAKQLWQTLAVLRGEMTVFAITHQPELAAQADRVYRLVDGRAVLLLHD